MTTRVGELVEWEIQPRRGVLGALSKAYELAGAVVLIRAGTWSKPPRDARVPDSSAEPLKLEAAWVRGHAPWMPPDWSGPQRITLTRDAATITPDGLHPAPRLLPLTEMELVGAQRLTGSWFPKSAGAEWELVLTAAGGTVRITGRWLTLAWLGHLARWPEPDNR